MKEDGIWDVQRRNNVQGRRGRQYVITSPHFSSLSILERSPYTETMILDPAITDLVFKHQIKVVPTENTEHNVSATKQVENLSLSSWHSFVVKPRRLQAPA